MINATNTVTSSEILQPADPEAAYQALFDALGEAYWAASDVASKDQIQSARDASFRILTAIHQAKLEANTSELSALAGYVSMANLALNKLKTDINQIVKRIEVAADVEAAIGKVLSLAGALA